jgi:hypothetical protein
MQIARLQNEKSVAEIVTRVYGLSDSDPRAAAAAAGISAANPHLGANPGSLPAGTPLVVPSVPGVNVQVAASIDPRHAAAAGVLDTMIASANQAWNAQETGSAATAPATPSIERTQALAQLQEDVAAFKKLHSVA